MERKGADMKCDANKRAKLLAILLAFGAMAAQADTNATPSPRLPADSLASASADVQRVARWIVDSGDNAGMPFLLVDKVNAQVLAFNRIGQLQGSAPALLGMARGDRLLAPNDMEVDAIPEDERITPAGRFVSRLAMDSHGKELLVIDYAASISLHAVVKGTPEERRAERLGSKTSKDNRISHGCINVPTEFYSGVVSPTFTNTRGVVYILPETQPASDLFGPGPGGARVASSEARQGALALDPTHGASAP